MQNGRGSTQSGRGPVVKLQPLKLLHSATVIISVNWPLTFDVRLNPDIAISAYNIVTLDHPDTFQHSIVHACSSSTNV